MKRREFITRICVSSAAAALPQAARTQPSRKIAKIGVLWHAGSAEEEGQYFAALIQGFRDLGYVEGRNVIFEHRYADERYSRFPLAPTGVYGHRLG